MDEQKTIKRIDKAELSRPAPTGRCFIVVHYGTWGKGNTIGDALKLSRKNGGKGKYLVYEADAAAEVDEYGGIVRPDGMAPSYLLHRVIP